MDRRGPDARRATRARGVRLPAALRRRESLGRVPCLRIAYISRVIDAGATPKRAVDLARHADPKLTFKTYARTGLNDLGRVLDRVSAADTPRAGEPAVLQATGPDDSAPSIVRGTSAKTSVQGAKVRIWAPPSATGTDTGTMEPTLPSR